MLSCSLNPWLPTLHSAIISYSAFSRIARGKVAKVGDKRASAQKKKQEKGGTTQWMIALWLNLPSSVSSLKEASIFLAHSQDTWDDFLRFLRTRQKNGNVFLQWKRVFERVLCLLYHCKVPRGVSQFSFWVNISPTHCSLPSCSYFLIWKSLIGRVAIWCLPLGFSWKAGTLEGCRVQTTNELICRMK